MYKQKLGDSFHNYNACTMQMDEIFTSNMVVSKCSIHSFIAIVSSVNLFESCLKHFPHHEVNTFDEMMQEQAYYHKKGKSVNDSNCKGPWNKFYFIGSLKFSYFSY